MAGGGAVFSDVPENSITLAKLAHGTANKYLGFDGSGVPSELSVSTAIQTGTMVMGHDVVIGNYTRPTIKLNEKGESYVDQPAFDAAWVSSDTAVFRGDPVNDDIRGTAVSDGTDNNLVHDLGAVLGSKFVLRCELTVSAITEPMYFHLFLSDKGSATASNGVQKFVGIQISSSDVFAMNGDGVDPQAAGTQTDTTYNVVDGTKFYIQFAVDGTNFQVKLFSDANFSVQVGSTVNQTITATGFQFIRLAERILSNASAYSIILDNIVVIDGVGSFPSNGSINLFDNDNTTKETTPSEVNPTRWVDMGELKNMASIAVNLDTVLTTETEITLETTPDDPNGAPTWTKRRTRLVSDFSDGVDKFSRIPVTSARAYRIRGNSGLSKVLSINDTAVKVVTSTDGHGHLDISPTDNTLGDDGS